MKKNKRREMSSAELKKLLRNRVVHLECSHRFCLHPLSNTMIITADGKVYCHNCYL